MFCKRTGHIFLCTSRRLTGFCVLLAAMTCGNILYWIAQWQNSGVILCSMDVFLCVLHPSFLFMIFVPFCLLTAMISSRFFTVPFSCHLFQNRKQLIAQIMIQNVIHALLFELVIIICACFMAFVLFDTDLTMNWTQAGSRYWHDTGHRLQQTLTPASFILWQGLAACIAGIIFSLVFQITVYSCRNIRRGNALGWFLCLCAAWSISFPISPMFSELQRIVTFSTFTIQNGAVGVYFLCAAALIIFEYAMLGMVIARRDFL